MEPCVTSEDLTIFRQSIAEMIQAGVDASIGPDELENATSRVLQLLVVGDTWTELLYQKLIRATVTEAEQLSGRPSATVH